MSGARSKIGILSLGCPRNLVDSEGILSRLKIKGYDIVDIDKAQVAIINTCSFIDEAKKESIEAILDVARLKKQGTLKKIIVYGCLTQRYKNALVKELPEVDAFVGKVCLDPGQEQVLLTPGHYAYMKICEGCVNSCSYCVIPKIKGRFVSLDIDSLVKKAGIFDIAGVKELNIIGQDITGYGLDLYGKRKLPELIKRLLKVAKNIGWLRLLYLFPGDIINELLEIIIEEPRVCKYVDLPLQHINDRILKLMRRGTNKSELLRLIEKIREKAPAVAIRTAFITGFPSETEAEFKELLDFVKEARFERLGVFIYSREEGTAAYRLKGQIPRAVKAARFDQLMRTQQEVSRLNNEKLLGKVIKVLIDEKEGDSYIARSEYDAPEVDGQVYVRSKRLLKPGDFVEARIIDTMEYDLVGETVE
ncbi:MAG: 30S ribosomal protein S12 methylthiotransferase RimO [Candidatus Omnitrophica bacterium]|nr:30S ribosomal protein S12 methylthiotransferase RimO [Candidatus Omnitrophota bacterium]